MLHIFVRFQYIFIFIYLLAYLGEWTTTTLGPRLNARLVFCIAQLAKACDCLRSSTPMLCNSASGPGEIGPPGRMSAGF
jgi:hypothetical protein